MNIDPSDLSLRSFVGAAPTFSILGFSVAANVLMLTGPLYMLQIYDRVLASGSVPTLLALTLLAAAALATMAVVEAMRAAVLGWVAVHFELAAGGRVLVSAFEASKLRRDAIDQSFRDVSAVRQFLDGQGPTAFLDAPWVPAYLILIFFFHPLLGTVAAVGAGVIFSLAVVNEYCGQKPLREGNRLMESARAILTATADCRHAVAAMGMLPSLSARWSTRAGEGLDSHFRSGVRTHSLQAAARSVRHGLQIAMLGTGAVLAVEGAITAGVMIVASIIMGRALAPVEQAISQWRSFLTARAAWHRLHGVVRSVGLVDEDRILPRPGGRVVVEKAACVPPNGDRPILRGLSFTVAPGEFLAVIGPSGAGKSSLVRLLTGFWRPASGDVQIDGLAVADIPYSARARRIGFMPQEIELLDGTVAENISRFSAAPNGEEIRRVARLAGAEGAVLRLPAGYETQLSAPGQTLSGGQRQSVGLARAMYGKPSLVILDEPGASLDAEGEAALQTAISELRKSGTTIILVAHRPALVSQADRILVLKEGVQQAFGPINEVLPRVVNAETEHRQHAPRAGQAKSGGRMTHAGA